MRFRPGVCFIAGLVILVALGGFAFMTPFVIPFSVGLIVVMIAIGIYEWRTLARELSQIVIQRQMPSVVARGRLFTVSVIVESTNPRTINAVIRDHVPDEAVPVMQQQAMRLTPGSHVFQYDIIIPKRGLHEFGTTSIRITGPVAFLEVQKSLTTAGKIRVLPEVLVPDDELSKQAMDEQQLMDQVSESRHGGEGTEFESLSEYREGDDIRRINWRSSARMKRLIVCKYQLEQHRDVVILLDCGRLMGTAVGNGTKLDCSVNAALAIAKIALRTGDRCGLGIFDSKVRGYLAPVAGPASHRMIVDRLYDIKPGWVESNFGPMFATLQTRQLKRALILIISDMMDSDTTERYRAALAALRGRHEVLFAALRTPLIEESSVAPITDEKDVARKAFAFRLMREREQTLHTLRRAGIHVLDVEPRKLTVPLINMFIDIKSRSVL